MTIMIHDILFACMLTNLYPSFCTHTHLVDNNLLIMSYRLQVDSSTLVINKVVDVIV